MKISKQIYLAPLFLCGLFIACESNNSSTELGTFDAKIQALMQVMTLEEKVAQLTQDAPKNERLGIPFMKFGECLHGLWEEGATVYPQAIGLGSTWDPALIKKMTSQIAKEARSVNITHCYSPNLDVISGDPRYGRVEESYGEDPYLVSRMGVAFIQGLQGEGSERLDENHVIATAKHFVGYPENSRGINGGFSDMSERRLREVFLPPFEAAVKEAEVGSIMPGHQDFNGIPCHMNSWLLDDVLRKELGFKGFIVSDNNDILRTYTMHSIAESKEEAAILGLKTGVDMNLVLGKHEHLSTYIMPVIQKAIEKDPTIQGNIDQSVRRILRAKYELGLFETFEKEYQERIVSTKEHQDFALQLAHKSMVLLKNDNQLLPLDKKNIRSIAVIGPNAAEIKLKNGTYPQLGGYSGIPPYYISLLEGIQKKVGDQIKINYAQGASLLSDSKEGFDKAIAAAQKSDVVVLAIGGTNQTCGEGVDRSQLGLYGVQNELARAIQKTGKPIVAILINGRPLAIRYVAEEIPAILETWYGGMRSGDAIADVLFGDVNPGGKLTVSFPRSIGQLPVTYLERPDFVGAGKGLYKFSDKSPLFPFGFGLSYTSFNYSDLMLSKQTIGVHETTSVSVKITNTGTRDGDEVVQMYVKDDFASVGRYLKMLKGFQRVNLKVGETKTVAFELNPNNLAVLNAALKKEVEPGTFTIMLGASSLEKDLKNIRLTVQ